MRLWVAYGPPPFYLPMAVADSAAELAEITGVSVHNIRAASSHLRRGDWRNARYASIDTFAGTKEETMNSEEIRDLIDDIRSLGEVLIDFKDAQRLTGCGRASTEVYIKESGAALPRVKNAPYRVKASKLLKYLGYAV